MVEYQDSQAFTLQAESLLHASNAINHEMASQIQKLYPMFVGLDQKIDDLASPEEVTSAIHKMIQQISMIISAP